MAIPTRILTLVKTLLRIPSAVTTFDARIQSAYERELLELTRNTDLFASEEQISAVTGQAVYTASTGTTRILGVLHNQVELPLVPSRTMDLLTDWQEGQQGTPESWTYDRIDPIRALLAEVIPLNFSVRPVPDTIGSGDAGLTIYVIKPPTSDNPTFTWLDAYLVYRTLAAFSDDGTEEHDSQAALIWGELAKIWKDVIMKKFG